MGELFGEWVPSEWIEEVIKATYKCPQHTFLFLTKNPRRYWHYQTDFGKNCWIGTTVCNSEMVENIKHLVSGPPVRFVSFEPLLGSVFYGLFDLPEEVIRNINWMIAGAQTNPERQPELDWVDYIIKLTRYYHIPLFMKNNLDWTHKIQEIPKLEV
jgi:protein gp37